MVKLKMNLLHEIAKYNQIYKLNVELKNYANISVRFSENINIIYLFLYSNYPRKTYYDILREKYQTMKNYLN